MKITKSFVPVVAIAVLVVCTVGCRKKQTDANAIRAAITQHLVSLKTLNLEAMDMDVTIASIQGDQAQADVTFRPKTGAPAGAAMQVTYKLERRGNDWAVVKTEAVGGVIEHPAAGTNPHLQPGQPSTHGNLPNVQELLAPFDSGTKKALPPGHPPVTTAPSSKK